MTFRFDNEKYKNIISLLYLYAMAKRINIFKTHFYINVLYQWLNNH